MATIAVTSTAWGSGIALSADTPIQNEGPGDVRVGWGGSEPAVGDGFLLRDGEAIIIPTGNTIYLAAAGSVDSVVWYESFA